MSREEATLIVYPGARGSLVAKVESGETGDCGEMVPQSPVLCQGRRQRTGPWLVVWGGGAGATYLPQDPILTPSDVKGLCARSRWRLNP